MSRTVRIPGGARVVELVSWYDNDANVLAAFPTEAGQAERDIRTTFTLIPEHGNRHDAHAVAVYAGDIWITYVERVNATGLHRELVKIEADGAVAQFDGIMRIARGSDGGLHWRAAVSLPKLSEIYPLSRTQARAASSPKRPAKTRRAVARTVHPRRTVPVPPADRLLWITTASVLLGWLGIDRFLNRQPLLGLAKLLTIGGLGFWWLADVIYFGWLLIRANMRQARL